MLEATRLQLAAVGVEGLNTNEVAKAAGVSIGSLYQYYPSKESLVTAALVQQREQIRDEVTDALESAAADPTRPWTREIVDAFVRNYANPAWLRVALEHVPEMDARRKLDPIDAETVDVVRAFFEHCGRDEDPVGDAQVVYALLDGTLASLARRAGDVIDGELAVDLDNALRAVLQLPWT